MRSLLTLTIGLALSGCSGTNESTGCLSDSDCPEGYSCVFQGGESENLNACVAPEDPGALRGDDANTQETPDGGGIAPDEDGEGSGPACEPDCTGKNCGDNGCGGLCGTCFGNYSCEEGTCTPCQPQCEGKTCGDDGCGASCGECAEGEVCTASQCGPPPPPICLQMTPCLMEACADSAEGIDTCLEEAASSCGPAETPAQESAAVGLVSCMAENGCSLQQDANGAECQGGFCMAETVSCSQAVEGVEECHTILNCIDGDSCPKDFLTGEVEITCVAECIENASAEAAAKYWDLVLCVDAECLGNPEYTDMQLCFDDKTKNGGPCGWPLRDCLVTALN